MPTSCVDGEGAKREERKERTRNPRKVMKPFPTRKAQRIDGKITVKAKACPCPGRQAGRQSGQLHLGVPEMVSDWGGGAFLPQEEVGEQGDIRGEGRDLCYSGPFHDVTSFIVALKGNGGRAAQIWKGVGWVGGMPTKEH